MNSTRKKPLSTKKYRRKKKVVRHANPLFGKWLQEWEKEAGDLGSNMKYNYRRARLSLGLFPLPVYSGTDCLIIANFGEKMCKMLDKRLQQHIDENGPVIWDEIHKVVGTPVKKKRVRKKTAEKTVLNQQGTPNVPGGNPEISPCGSTKKCGYVPAYRSGAYALIVALYMKNIEGGPGFMKKADLIETAQPLCNGSFTQASDGSYYTAWSSMGTLIKKNLIVRESNPSKYSLTASGKELGRKLLSAGQSGTWTNTLGCEQSNKDGPDVVPLSSRSCSPIAQTNSPSKEPDDATEPELPNFSDFGRKIQKNIKGNADIMIQNSTSERPLSSKLTEKESEVLVFSYVTSLDMETPLKDRAVVSVEDDGFLGFLIKCRLSSLISSDLSYRIDDTRKSPLGFTYAYLSNECAPETSPGLLSPSQKQNTKMTKKRKPAVRRQSQTVDAPSEDEKVINSDIRKVGNASSCSESSLSSKSQGSLLGKISAESCSQRSSESVPSVKRIRTELQVSSQSPFSLLAGTYDIVLCVDNCETKGGFLGASKFNTRDIIVNELNKHKILHDVRKLHVGDFLWIARERTFGHSSTKQAKELVLPYIVERKRMDDLASSIRDGRFKEQKFRLKQSGLSTQIYLVEEYGSQYLSIPESTCTQAIANTQVVDDFIVKVTKDQMESAAYLTIMTRCLQSKYQGKSIRSITVDDIVSQEQEQNGVVETALMTFSDLNTLSMKNRQLSIKDMFAKHLLQFHGLSVDKAKAVTEKYGTPAALISAYEDLKDPSESEQMIAPLKFGKPGRQLGPTLSMTVSKLYTNLILK